MSIKVSNKTNDLVATLQEQFEGKIHLARIRFIAFFIQALCKVQTVTFEKLANSFDTTAKPESSLRRIQRFIASFDLKLDYISILIFKLIPNNTKVSLTIDRTNWKFGTLDINIFMLGIVYDGVAFPLMFSILPKRGNSNSKERIDLVDRFIGLFGLECIESIMADREFIGQEWLDYLNGKSIRYYIRIRNNFKVFLPHKNREVKAWHLFNRLDCNEFMFYHKIVKVNAVLCYLSGCKIKNDYLIIVSFNKPEESLKYYEQRWQIEMCFRALKSSGFNLENTHLVHLERIEKLFALVMIAFVWCYIVGIHLHAVVPIKIKAHGRKAKSIFKYGLNHIAQVLLNSNNKDDMNICKFLSCT